MIAPCKYGLDHCNQDQHIRSTQPGVNKNSQVNLCMIFKTLFRVEDMRAIKTNDNIISRKTFCNFKQGLIANDNSISLLSLFEKCHLDITYMYPNTFFVGVYAQIARKFCEMFHLTRFHGSFKTHFLCVRITSCREQGCHIDGYSNSARKT